MNRQLVLILMLSIGCATVSRAGEKEKSSEKNNLHIKKEVLREKILSKLSVEKKPSHTQKVTTHRNVSEEKDPVTRLMAQKSVVPSIKAELENMKKITSYKQDAVSKKSSIFEPPFEKKGLCKDDKSSSTVIPSKNVLLNQDTRGWKFAGSEPNAGRNGAPLTASNVSQF